MDGVVKRGLSKEGRQKRPLFDDPSLDNPLGDPCAGYLIGDPGADLPRRANESLGPRLSHSPHQSAQLGLMSVRIMALLVRVWLNTVALVGPPRRVCSRILYQIAGARGR